MNFRLSSLASLMLVFHFLGHAQKPTAVQASLEHSSLTAAKNMADCARLIYVESPTADTYTSLRADTMNFGDEISMRLRGLPQKKSMVSHLTFGASDIDRAKVVKCFLKVYTVAKQSDSKLSVYKSEGGIIEGTTSWSDQPAMSGLLSSKVLGNDASHEFDVTNYVLANLDDGEIHFCLRTDSKKPIEISSRESGLGSELIIESCDGIDSEVYGTSGKKKYGMEVLPSPQNGKLTIELRGVPAGGFGDLMLMDEHGGILRQLPMAIRDGYVLRHSLDYGDLIPGIYWAVFRKGRVMVRDQFRIKPSEQPNRLLEIVLDPPDEKSAKN